jgi:peptidoglycan hydrolase CwlO-like protein
MSIWITLFFLVLISFWILGYAYLDCQTMVQVKQRQLQRIKQDLERKMSSLEQEQSQSQSNVQKLQKEIENIQQQMTGKKGKG